MYNNNMYQNEISNSENDYPIINKEMTSLRAKSHINNINDNNNLIINNNLNNNLNNNSNFNINDPFYESQQKSLDEFKKVLSIVDQNLDNINVNKSENLEEED